MAADKKFDKDTPASTERSKKRLRAFESAATFGLLLLAVGLVAPFTSIDNSILLESFKWIFTAGAAIYLIARLCGGSDPDDSVRVRRLRRLEVWAGVAFSIGAFFWFYNASRYAGFPMTLGMMRDTVVFTLAGALIQIIAAWMIVARKRKDASGNTNESPN